MEHLSKILYTWKEIFSIHIDTQLQSGPMASRLIDRYLTDLFQRDVALID